MNNAKDKAFNTFMGGYGFALNDQEYSLVKEAWQAATEAAQTKLATQQLRIEQLESALKYVKNEIENPPDGLTEYFKKEVILGTIDNALSTPTTSEHLKEWMMGKLEVVKDAFGNNVFPFDVYRIKESDN